MLQIVVFISHKATPNDYNATIGAVSLRATAGPRDESRGPDDRKCGLGDLNSPPGFPDTVLSRARLPFRQARKQTNFLANALSPEFCAFTQRHRIEKIYLDPLEVRAIFDRHKVVAVAI